MSLVIFQDKQIHLSENEHHTFLMPTKDVALGYGCSIDTINHNKLNHKDELIEGKHFIMVKNANNVNKAMWTKRGVVRLGFFIKSEQAKAFRDWAEDYVVDKENDTNYVPYSLLYSKERECIELKRAMNRITENEKLVFNDPQTHNAVLDLLGYASRATKTIKRLGEELIDYADQMEKGLNTIQKNQGHQKGVVTQCNRLPRHQIKKD